MSRLHDVEILQVLKDDGQTYAQALERLPLWLRPAFTAAEEGAEISLRKAEEELISAAALGLAPEDLYALRRP